MLDTERSRPDLAAPAAQPTGEELSIPAEDGRLLAATLYAPPGGAAPAAPLTVIAGGTGIPRSYYARFAAWLAERGRPALTFDYRDSGGSRSGPLEASKVRMRDWCILDVPGVLAWSARERGIGGPGRPLHWVGHSLGGFAVGLAHNNHLIGRQLSIAALSGYWRRMAVPERYRVLLAMGALAPLVIRARGYVPGVLLGGEDMPGPAFLEWRRWCLSPGFLFDDPTLPEVANFARLRAPVRFAQIEDDTWATPAAVGAMVGRFTGAAERSIWSNPPGRRERAPHRPPRLLPLRAPRHALAGGPGVAGRLTGGRRPAGCAPSGLLAPPTIGRLRFRRCPTGRPRI